MKDVSLRDYIDTRLKGIELQIEAQGKFISQHFILNEKAIQKAEEATGIRLDKINGFRAQINKERGEYLTKEAQLATDTNIDRRLKDLEVARAFSAGKMWMVMAVFTLVPTALALVALFR